MIIKGKYNAASVMIDDVDPSTYSQIREFVNHEAFAGAPIAIMSDCHAGKGCCIGFTQALGKKVVPNVIGVDIGCGVLACQFPLKELDVRALDEFIRREIPSGFSVNAPGREIIPLVEYVTNEIGSSADYAMASLGSLGGGNHFIEAGVDSAGNYWIAVHSGSRNLGLKIAEHYTTLAEKQCADRGLSTRGIAWLDCDSPEGAKYIEMQQYAIAYASRNRWAIMDTIAWHLKSEACMEVETIHNYIGVDDVIRKGAVSAKKDERLVIPFNMRDGIAICVGKGNPDWNNSAPHGAGRILSRSQAKRQLDVGEFQATMQAAGVYTTSADETTLDEAPGAYKNRDVILACIKDTVEVVDFIKPVYNFKAGNERRDRKRKPTDD